MFPNLCFDVGKLSDPFKKPLLKKWTGWLSDSQNEIQKLHKRRNGDEKKKLVQKVVLKEN